MPVEFEQDDKERGRIFANKVSPTADGGLTIYFRDITQSKQTEALIASDLKAPVETRLHEVGNLCVRAGDQVEQCLDELLATAIAITAADKGNIQLLDPASSSLHIAAQRGFSEPFLKFFASVSEETSACGTAMQSAERVIIEDVTQSRIFAGQPSLNALLEADVRAVLESTPLMSSAGNLLGMYLNPLPAAASAGRASVAPDGLIGAASSRLPGAQAG